jgi:hypothetical protein
MAFLSKQKELNPIKRIKQVSVVNKIVRFILG